MWFGASRMPVSTIDPPPGCTTVWADPTLLDDRALNIRVQRDVYLTEHRYVPRPRPIRIGGVVRDSSPEEISTWPSAAHESAVHLPFGGDRSAFSERRWS